MITEAIKECSFDIPYDIEGNMKYGAHYLLDDCWIDTELAI